METRVTRLSLLCRVRDPGDAAAWREFEQRYADLVLRYALARGLQFADAEDVRQAVFLRLSRYLREFTYQPQRGRFRSYLGAIVRNVVAERGARPASPGTGVDGDGTVLAGLADRTADELDERWEREWENHHCRLALETIRRTFDARSVAAFEDLLSGVAADEVAVRHGLTPEALAKVRQRVRKRMSELIAEQVRDEDAE